MSAQNPRRPGVLTALAGLVGFSAIAGVLVAVMVAPALAVTSVAATGTISVFDSLPDYIDVGTQPQQNKIMAIAKYDSKGKPVYTRIATVFSQNREEIAATDVTEDLKHAVLAAEDTRFYDHGGIDVQGVVRAAISTALGHTQGASTLTQQLVKNVCVSNAVKDYPNQDQYQQQQDQIKNVCQAQTLERKIKEMKQAIALEKRYSKDEILLGYLNIAAFGGNVYGIQSAAQRYYGVDVDKLTVPQMASLLGIVQDPNNRRLDVAANYAANEQRRNYILRQMRDNGWLSDADYQADIATHVDASTVKITAPRAGCIAANRYATYFCDYIVRSVKDLPMLGATPDERLANWRIGGYTVKTTLDLSLNKTATQTLMRYAPPKESSFQLGSSAVSLEPGTGRIRVMAENKTYDVVGADGKEKPGTTTINYNTDYDYGGSNGFQPGSSWKLFTLINWLEHGHGLNENVDVTPVKTPNADFTDSCPDAVTSGYYNPRNFSNERGLYSVKQATVHSINGGFVQMALQLDMCDTVNIAKSLGAHRAQAVTTSDGVHHDVDDLSSNPAAILGVDNIAPMTIAAAYAAMANNGVYCAPIAVDDVTGPDGTDLGGQQPQCKQVVPSDVAAAVDNALQAAAAGYNGNPKDGTPIIGKTGTTNDANQTWATISSSALTTSVWFGNVVGNRNINNFSSGGTYGGDQRHQIARAIMTQADKRWKGKAFPTSPARLINGLNVTVGDYTGLSEDDAQQAIEALKFTFDNEGDIASGLPKGTVAKQSPAAGVKLSPGQRIRVWLSDGSEGLIPDLVGTPQDFATAKASLQALGYSYIVEECRATPVQTAVVPAPVIDPATGQPVPGTGTTPVVPPEQANLPVDGQVIAQMPAAGRSLSYDRRIALTTAHASCG